MSEILLLTLDVALHLPAYATELRTRHGLDARSPIPDLLERVIRWDGEDGQTLALWDVVLTIAKIRQRLVSCS